MALALRPALRWLPAACFALMVGLALAFHSIVAGSIDRIRLTLSTLEDPMAAARFASASRVWGAMTYTGFLTIVVVLVLAVATIVQLGTTRRDARCPGPFATAWLALIAVVTASALVVEFFLNDSSPYHELLDPAGHPLLPVRLHWISALGNALMISVVLSLFGAGAAIVRQAQELADLPVAADAERIAGFAALRRRLSVILGAGAVATVVGVLQHTALNRLPPSLATAADETRRAALEAALNGLAASEASFWGVVFTTGLALLYLPCAWAIHLEESSRPAAAAEEDGSRLEPIVKLLAGLSPLLVGLLSQLLSSTAVVVQAP